MSNPYLDIWRELGQESNPFERAYRQKTLPTNGRMTQELEDEVDDFYRKASLRRRMCSETTQNGGYFGLVHLYSWAIPDEAAIDAIIEGGPVLEIGAGTGYWSRLIDDAGGDIIATDLLELDGHWKGVTWFDVVKADAVDAVRRYQQGRSLLVVWPPMTDMASEALAAYTGRRVYYVGEGSGGCTGDTVFHRELDISGDWMLTDTIAIPTWDGIHDRLWIYERVRGQPLGLDPARLANV